MAKTTRSRTTSYTVWTIPKSSWKTAECNLTGIDEEVVSKMREEIANLKSKLDDRLAQYKAPVTDETMRLLVS